MRAQTIAEECAPRPYDVRRCPACDHVKGNKADAKGVFTCAACGGLFHNSGTLYLGDSYEYVLPQWDAEGACAVGDQRYFDFTTLGSKGVQRRHGAGTQASRWTEKGIKEGCK